jgi:hypothetical protein
LIRHSTRESPTLALWVFSKKPIDEPGYLSTAPVNLKKALVSLYVKAVFDSFSLRLKMKNSSIRGTPEIFLKSVICESISG